MSGVKGKIYRVSGPLVIADGMRGTRVYEVVEVGDERLIGEIIGVEGDKAIIQVYEDTTGLRVGDPVYATGMPLAAELGPGLITSIYDGIQRPLPVLEQLIGFFVKKGVKAPSIPRDKKWFFKPLVKKGDKVGEGDFIGVVEETETVKHYIMVPPGIHGVVEEIAGEGDYTVEETIARVDGNSLKMMHKWPVRKPRPYREKLEPSEPLLTGQRVIDFFFPLARGGKAAIPGGFGTGKCVLPRTPVLLADGGVVAIDDLFREVKGGEPDYSLDEEVFETGSKNIKVYAFDGEKFVKARVTHVYRGYTDRVVRIKTASGRVLEVTPSHKLPLFNPGGYIEFVEAVRLKPMDYIVVPREILIRTEKLVKTPLEQLAEDDSVVSRDDVVNDIVRKIIRSLPGDVLSDICVKTGLSMEDVRSIAHSKGSIPLKLIKHLHGMINGVGYPKYIGLREDGERIKVPEVFDNDLAEFLGLLLSRGLIKDSGVVFNSDNPVLRERFSELAGKLFEVEVLEKRCEASVCVEIASRLLTMFLKTLGIPFNDLSGSIALNNILKSPEEVVASFLRGYYLGSGRFTEYGLELYSVSKKMTSLLAYVLTRLGILYSIADDGYVLKITGLSDLNKFIQVISRNAPSIKNIEWINELSSSMIEEKRKVVEETSSSQMVLGEHSSSSHVYVEMYSTDQEGLGVKQISVGNNVMLIKVRDKMDKRVSKKHYRVLKQFALDRVVEVTVVDMKTPVYDITVEYYHNFVGGEIPTIFHNTVTLHQLTKWSHVDIAIFVGCGERGNEMADALHSFRRLKDPRTGKLLVNRSVFIANTSNMPVAAREASVFLGVTIGEYFRDMGYNVLIVADSTSRWAEAMREISGRLEELPGEEGFPAYLGSRLASFYERSGMVKTLGKPDRVGSLTIMGAVSPPGADFSEPVTQATLRIVRALYALDVALAYRRHYPAINWLTSYSLYVENVADWWHKNVDPEWRSMRERALNILQREAELEELVRLVGVEALPEEDKLLLEVARMIREDFLAQNAFHEIDTYCPARKAALMMRTILLFYDLGREALEKGVTVDKIRGLKVRARIARMKEIPNIDYEPEFRNLYEEIKKEYMDLIKEVEVVGKI